MHNRHLALIGDGVLAQTGNSLAQCELPQPKISTTTLDNREYLRKTNYDADALRQVVSFNEELLTDEQLNVYKQILSKMEKAIG